MRWTLGARGALFQRHARSSITGMSSTSSSSSYLTVPLYQLQYNYYPVARAPSLLRCVRRGRRGCVLDRRYQHQLSFANQGPDRLEDTSRV